MKKIFAVLGLAAVTMGSCTTDISEDLTNARGTTELTAALEGTRTHLGDKDGNTGLYKVYWSNGDCIAVNGRQSDALSNVEEGTASAAFFVNEVINPPYDVIYPASAYVDGRSYCLRCRTATERRLPKGRPCWWDAARRRRSC